MKKRIFIIITVCCLISTVAYSQTKINSELFKVIKRLDVEGVKSALENGADPNARHNSKARKTALDWTSSHVLFYKYGSKTKNYQEDEAKKRLIEIFKLLFNAGAEIQKETDILYFPITENMPSILELLLEKGANPNERNVGGSMLTPIEIAEENGHKNMVKILIKYGAAAISFEDAVQLRFIKLASGENIVEMEKLLKNGASIDGTNSAGEDALHNAVGSYKFAVVAFLLEKGADPNIKGKGGGPLSFPKGTPLHIWAFLSPPKGIKENSYRKMTSMLIGRNLLKAGASVSARNENGATPLHIAAEFDKIEAAKIFLEAGAKVMPKDNKGWTPLDYAESAEMIKLLKSYGAKEQ